jgi:hypothetical protein
LITASALATLALTVVWIPLAAGMVWKCWKAPPVPEIRTWAIAVAGMALAMLLQGWRAELWKTRYLVLLQTMSPRTFQSWQTLQSCSISRLSSQPKHYQNDGLWLFGDQVQPEAVPLGQPLLVLSPLGRPPNAVPKSSDNTQQFPAKINFQASPDSWLASGFHIHPGSVSSRPIPSETVSNFNNESEATPTDWCCGRLSMEIQVSFGFYLLPC